MPIQINCRVVDRSEPHQLNFASLLVGLAALDSPYEYFRN
jgi:hypothetical protein